MILSYGELKWGFMEVDKNNLVRDAGNCVLSIFQSKWKAYTKRVQMNKYFRVGSSSYTYIKSYNFLYI